MLSAEKIATLSATAAAATKTLEGLVLKLNLDIEAISADGGLAAKQQEFKIREVRGKASPAVIAQLKVIQDIARQVSAAKRYWDSTEFILSRQTFGDVLPSTDATIKSWHAGRLRAMSLPLLALEFEHAKEEKNIAMLALILSERGGRQLGEGEVIDRSQFSLAGVEIPGRDVALKAIEVAEANRVYGEYLFSEANGRGTPAGKMAAAGGLRQNQPVKHAPSIVRNDLSTLPESSHVTGLPAAT